jgi:sugar phosphate isomerase/epimerase
MHKLILEFLCAREVNPIALGQLALRHDIRAIAVCLNPFKALSGGSPPFSALQDWDLVGDTANRRELKRWCDAEGVEIVSADPFLVSPDVQLDQALPALESAGYLGAKYVTIIPLDTDMDRLADRVRSFCAKAANFGLSVIHEHSPRMAMKTVRESIAFQRRVEAPNLRMVVDALHFFRGDNTLEDLATLRSSDLARLQLCDGPAAAPAEGGGYEAFYERMVPGEGVFPLQDLVKAVPADTEIGLEVPIWSMQMAGVQPAERVQRIVAGARGVLAAAGRA